MFINPLIILIRSILESLSFFFFLYYVYWMRRQATSHPTTVITPIRHEYRKKRKKMNKKESIKIIIYCRVFVVHWSFRILLFFSYLSVWCVVIPLKWLLCQSYFIFDSFALVSFMPIRFRPNDFVFFFSFIISFNFFFLFVFRLRVLFSSTHQEE